MESIDSLIFTEFTNAGYNPIGEVSNSLVFSNIDKSDFWIILDDFVTDVEYQKNLFVKYKELTSGYPAADKNVSVLVMKKVEHIDSTMQKLAIEMENDRFFFKKYVLLYTNEALEKLTNDILNDSDKTLSDYLRNAEVFENLKKDSIDGAYTLLYGIAHKLPFVLVEMEKSDLNLAYPVYWSSPKIPEIDNWVDELPDEEGELYKYLEELFKNIDNEQNKIHISLF